MTYVSQDLGTDVIRIMPLIKNCVLMVVNGIDPLGFSLVRGKSSPWILLSPVFLEHLLPLALTGALSWGSPTLLSPLLIIQNASLLPLATCMGSKLCSVISPEMKLSWQLTTDSTDVTRSHLRMWNYKEEENTSSLSKEFIHVSIFPVLQRPSRKGAFIILHTVGT